MLEAGTPGLQILSVALSSCGLRWAAPTSSAVLVSRARPMAAAYKTVVKRADHRLMARNWHPPALWRCGGVDSSFPRPSSANPFLHLYRASNDDAQVDFQ
ncbi:hypothetical protein GGR56DRAFT_631700 [Xylariaceae sp. FL0804]|nr:hypothetical protein GGR56DRAFT_631700 [Xylariaceae sp. FL0804]